MAFRHSWTLAAALLGATSAAASAQSLGTLTNPPPSDGTVYGFLLTDGSVMMQGGNLLDWWKLTPDAYGSYVNGTWQAAASLPPSYGPYATSGGVLPDGRLMLVGGEYLLVGTQLKFVLTTKSAIYDPVKDKWTLVAPPKGWSVIGDSPWTILADGRLMLGEKISEKAAVLDAKTLKWTALTTTGKHDFNAEEGWTLLRDGSVLAVDVKDHPDTERFLPNADPGLTRWVGAGKTPKDLRTSLTKNEGSIKYGHGQVYHPPGEVGPAILRPDGTVFATGGVCAAAKCIRRTKIGHTAIYHPGGKLTDAGTWTAGPDFSGGVAAGDSYAVLLPNGRVLVEANPAGTLPDSKETQWQRVRSHAARPVAPLAAGQTPATPTWTFYDFDGTALTPDPTISFVGGQGSMLLLPTGEVLLAGQYVYVPIDGYAPDWAPVVGSYPKRVTAGASYEVSGRQFNGLSQANAFGDEEGVATNYPLVRITNRATGRVAYARTHDHSSMGVATGKLTVSTHFDVPKTIEHGASLLEVVANGIPSLPMPVTVE